MSNAMASVGAFVNRKFSINRNTGQPRIRRFSVGEPSNTGEFLVVLAASRARRDSVCMAWLSWPRLHDLQPVKRAGRAAQLGLARVSLDVTIAGRSC